MADSCTPIPLGEHIAGGVVILGHAKKLSNSQSAQSEDIGRQNKWARKGDGSNVRIVVKKGRRKRKEKGGEK